MNTFLKTAENQDALDKEIRKVALENPDFVYNPFGGKVGCSYDGPCRRHNRGEDEKVGPDCKGCLFGTAAQNLGVTEFGSDEISFYVPPDSRYYETWIEIQANQDSGMSWGDSIKVKKSC